MSVEEIIAMLGTLSLKELIEVFKLTSEFFIKIAETNENL